MARFSDISHAAAILGFGIRHTRRLLINIPPMVFPTSSWNSRGGRSLYYKWPTKDVEALAEKLKKGL